MRAWVLAAVLALASAQPVLGAATLTCELSYQRTDGTWSDAYRREIDFLSGAELADATGQAHARVGLFAMVWFSQENVVPIEVNAPAVAADLSIDELEGVFRINRRRDGVDPSGRAWTLRCDPRPLATQPMGSLGVPPAVKPNLARCEHLRQSGGSPSAYLANQYRKCVRSEELRAGLASGTEQYQDGLIALGQAQQQAEQRAVADGVPPDEARRQSNDGALLVLGGATAAACVGLGCLVGVGYLVTR